MHHVIGVRHVGLPAKNLAALKAFYRDVLGMTVVREGASGGRSVRDYPPAERRGGE